MISARIRPARKQAWRCRGRAGDMRVVDDGQEAPALRRLPGALQRFQLAFGSRQRIWQFVFHLRLSNQAASARSPPHESLRVRHQVSGLDVLRIGDPCASAARRCEHARAEGEPAAHVCEAGPSLPLAWCRARCGSRRRLRAGTRRGHARGKGSPVRRGRACRASQARYSAAGSATT